MNTEKLFEVLDVMEMNLKRWNQRSWIRKDPECGTTLCLAGWVAELDGMTPVFEQYRDNAYYVRDAQGNRVTVTDYAADVLELTDVQRSNLFIWSAGITDFQEFRNYCKEIAAEDD
jgi:hypothetical protein